MKCLHNVCQNILDIVRIILTIQTVLLEASSLLCRNCCLLSEILFFSWIKMSPSSLIVYIFLIRELTVLVYLRTWRIWDTNNEGNNENELLYINLPRLCFSAAKMCPVVSKTLESIINNSAFYYLWETIQPYELCPSLLSSFWQSVHSSWDDQLVISYFFLKESLQLIDIHLGDAWPRGHKHAQHGVNPLQGHALQVGQHGLNVSPKQLKQNREKDKSVVHVFIIYQSWQKLTQ